MKIQDRRCFNCQKQGHHAASCKDETLCGNYGQVGHRHWDCMNVYQSCAICGGPHRAKSARCPGKHIVDSTPKQLFSQGPLDASNDSAFSNPNDFWV